MGDFLNFKTIEIGLGFYMVADLHKGYKGIRIFLVKQALRIFFYK